MECLVTGQKGFIMSHVARILKARGHTVTGIDLIDGSDYGDKELLRNLFDEYKFDIVFHGGAFAPEVLSHHKKNFIWNNNMLKSVTLLNQCVNSGVKRVVFTSSIAVYGDQQPPFSEDLQPKPVDTYGLAKWAFERELEVTHDMFGLDYTILRLFNVYGPGQRLNDANRNVFGIWINRLLQGKAPIIFGDGLQERAFTYIGDIADLVARSGLQDNTKNRIINLGADENVTVKKACNTLLGVSGSTLKPIYTPERHEVKQAWCNNFIANMIFGNYKKTTLENGLKAMWEFYKDTKPQDFQYVEDYEIESKLPDVWKKKML